MKKNIFKNELNGFFGTYYPKENAKFAFIALTDFDSKNCLSKAIGKWFNNLDINVLVISLNQNKNNFCSIEIEELNKAVKFLLDEGNIKIGIAGVGYLANLALSAASFIDDFSLVIAISPSDFVLEGFYKENGIIRFKDDESFLSFKGNNLPYLKLNNNLNKIKNFDKTRIIFDEAEKYNPLNEDFRIKVENIKGTIVFVGAKDDKLWNSAKYIGRMREALLNSMKKGANARFLIYEYGSNNLYPESFIKSLNLSLRLFLSSTIKANKLHKQEIKDIQIDLDKNIKEAIKVWKEINRITCANEKFEK